VIPILEPPTPLPDYTEAASFKTLPKDLAGRYHSAADYHAMYLSGELTPLAVAELLLPLIRKDIDPKNVHSVAFVDSRVDLVMEAATASTERYKLGKSLGVLDGVPLAIKDETDIAGYRTMLGRKRDDNLYKVKTETSWPVMKWQEAGAVVVGKVNMHELGTGRSPKTIGAREAS
jgi:Asp-tRNA(Asn)/Glu-tRNA(Gln) amidotransferase A subunit family amidase